MDWTRYLVSGLIFAVVFAAVGVLVFSAPLDKVVVSSVVASVLWVVLAHFAGVLRRGKEK
ncbi:MAG: hypothetical protein FWJ73_09125 [Limnochordales bacterium]